MKLFVDTNIFVSVITKEADRSDESKAVLNRFKDNHTSVLNLMELRSVLAKKKTSSGTVSRTLKIGSSTVLTSRSPTRRIFSRRMTSRKRNCCIQWMRLS